MEETNIPDQLTYHAPSQETTKEPKDALFMAARIISAIFSNHSIFRLDTHVP